jgi:hypothetical protein
MHEYMYNREASGGLATACLMKPDSEYRQTSADIQPPCTQKF